ncbi:MAG: aminopeptidase [Candidatus Cloacimonetes bacterium 4572_65]|nr:MAG: aminopeptidase [Candidatus Cloacimonetes bacterium 4572_65]
MEKEVKKNLAFSPKNFWKEASKEEVAAAQEFSTDYIQFLNECKNVRETINYTERELVKAGYDEILNVDGAKKVYSIFRGKTMAFAVIGNRPVSDGVNIIAAHVDAPKIDLKQNPLYEDSSASLAMGKTHYYGGIKKYQWVSTPLAIHGVVIDNEGNRIDICIGEDEKDPVFIIPDLLPHLARKVQYSKKIGEAITADKLNVILGSIPVEDKDQKDAIKYHVLELLNEKYGIEEVDFLSAELELVPAGKAREVGLDRSLVMGYGQDDRICAYTGLKALLEIATEDMERTSIVYFSDKEEVGSDSNTGAKSIFIQDFVGDVLKQNGEDSGSYNLRKTLMKSKVLSADVNAPMNPNYPSVHEKMNAPVCGFGVTLLKYTGAGGKGGSNDANAEFNAEVIRIFNQDHIFWQTGTLGKVDEGGGGTIAMFLAQFGADVIDCGPSLLGMHSLYEVVSKADLYSSYRAYKSFMLKA